MPNDSLHERVAEAIYDALRAHDREEQRKPWVPNGNILKQTEARERAHRALVGATVYGAMTDDGECQRIEAIFSSEAFAVAACEEYARRHTDPEGHANDTAGITALPLNTPTDWLPKGGAYVAEGQTDSAAIFTYWDQMAVPTRRTTRSGMHVTAYGETAQQACAKVRTYLRRTTRG